MDDGFDAVVVGLEDLNHVMLVKLDRSVLEVFVSIQLHVAVDVLHDSGETVRDLGRFVGERTLNHAALLVDFDGPLHLINYYADCRNPNAQAAFA